MALYDYIGALRQGRKQYQNAVSKGEYPYLPVLDEILANTEIASEVSLGVIDVPLEKIVGTKTQGRTQAFAANFMPLLGEKTEFGAKWAFLYDHQIEEGIHDPIVAYEFMNRYYVQEGNKRVSVLKYLNAYSISANVIRLIPKRRDDHDTRLYYEFLDFYQVSFNCDVWFSKEGSYGRLLKAMGKKPGQVWDEEERMYFKAAHDLFVQVFGKRRTPEIEMTASDAFLICVEIFGYDHVRERTETQLRQDLNRIWNELLLKSYGDQIALVEQPELNEKREKKETGTSKLFDWLRGSGTIEPEMLKIAFIYAKSAEGSSWAYAHELGRLSLEEKYGGKLQTVSFDHAGTEEAVESAINTAIQAGCNVIFTTSPEMAAQSVKAAVEHPEVQILNCSVNMSYSSICTYYMRTYESKFLMGALAASMSDSDDLGYLADYPIYGRIANINAFAMGARMVNPRVKVWLQWSGLKEECWREAWEKIGLEYVSGEDMITPAKASRQFGLYRRLSDGSVENLATPISDWGKFYAQVVELICQGGLDARNRKDRKAVNYWWGMSADVTDVICSESLPPYTKRLIRFLKQSISSGAFHPFEGEIEIQGGQVIGLEGRSLTPEEIVRMDWLTSNVIGAIPPITEFKLEAQPMIRLQGVRTEEKEAEVEQHENSGAVRS